MTARSLNVLIVVPTLQTGAADTGVVELVRILAAAGHKPIVASSGGRLAEVVEAAGGDIVQLAMDSQNPAVVLRNVFALVRLVRERRCHVVHAHGRAAAWRRPRS